MRHEVTFPLSYFSVTKSTKSHLRGFSILLKNTFRVHELVARALRGECVRQRTERKSLVSRSPQSQPYHACEHITRKSRADSCTHCLHARWIMGGGRGFGTYADGMESTFFILAILGFYLVGVGASTTRYGRGIDRFAKQTRSASPRQGKRA